MKPKFTLKAVRLAALQPPSLRTRETGEKRGATWLELFYDLVFVVAVARLGGRLLHADHLSGNDVLGFVGLFIVVWWTWAGFTFYADRFDTDDLGQRLLAMVQIVAVALMAASVSSGEAQSTRAFAIAYIVARLVLVTMYLRARYHVPETRTLISGYLRGMGAAIGLWVVSAFIPEPGRFVFWGIGMAIDLATPYIMRKEQARVPLDVTHLPERFGLFTILVLGEPVASVVGGLSESHWSASVTYSAIMSVFVTGSLWWLYFHNHEGSVVRRLPKSEPTWKPTAWIYAHLPLAMGVVATGIGLEFVLVDHAGTAERWILAGGLAVTMLAMATLLYVAVNPYDPRTNHKAAVRLVAIPLVVIVSMLANSMAMYVTTSIIAAVIAAQVLGDLIFEPHKTGRAEH
jgi:low temperature requirement protein LtrA